MLYLVSNNRHAAHISSGRLNARSGMNLIERMGEVMPASPSCAAGPLDAADRFAAGACRLSEG
jgi:hypothetical protein